MGTFSLWHMLILLGVALLLFGGKGKISEIMGDVAKGIKSFKKGMAEEDEAKKPEPGAAPHSSPKSIEAGMAKPAERAGVETKA